MSLQKLVLITFLLLPVTAHADIEVTNVTRVPIQQGGGLCLLIQLRSHDYQSVSNIRISEPEAARNPDPNAPVPAPIVNANRSILAFNFRPATELNESYLIIETQHGFRVIPKLGSEIERQLLAIDKRCSPDCVIVDNINGQDIEAWYQSFDKQVESFKFKIKVLLDGGLVVSRQK